MYRIVKYSQDFSIDWNHFVENAKNATFLFHRDFMEYHSDKFEDFSLLIFKNDKLQAILPANKKADEIHSHQGLTYGGFVFNENLKFETILELFKGLLKYLKTLGFKTLFIKQIPFIYTSFLNYELDYLMFLLKAELIKKDNLSVICQEDRLRFSNNRLEGFKRGIKHDLRIKEEQDFKSFWNEILIKNLESKHQVKPVHNFDEISILKKRFPNNIRQFNVYYHDSLVAGTTIFETKHVAHSQYISANEQKNKLGSLDFLYKHLLEDVFKNKRYFDFGSSNENNGLNLNKGLQFWKEGFGARSVTQDFYKLNIDNYHLLDNVFI